MIALRAYTLFDRFVTGDREATNAARHITVYRVLQDYQSCQRRMRNSPSISAMMFHNQHSKPNNDELAKRELDLKRDEVLEALWNCALQSNPLAKRLGPQKLQVEENVFNQTGHEGDFVWELKRAGGEEVPGGEQPAPAGGEAALAGEEADENDIQYSRTLYVFNDDK